MLGTIYPTHTVYQVITISCIAVRADQPMEQPLTMTDIWIETVHRSSDRKIAYLNSSHIELIITVPYNNNK